MSEWRKKQRTGKGKFLPLLDEINARLNTGETVKQIYIFYKESMAIELSYVQFTRYINKYCKDNNIHLTKMNDNKKQNKTKQNNNDEVFKNPLSKLSGASKSQLTEYNPTPDKSRIYGDDNE